MESHGVYFNKKRRMNYHPSFFTVHLIAVLIRPSISRSAKDGVKDT